ncbi:MAG: efflux RND transporter periplasmic adaptor subunit [Acidobacteria bacterium]|nr:efflux RND transporter periplasmic adaptor subunit [Acidobacteriota bacterium]
MRKKLVVPALAPLAIGAAILAMTMAIASRQPRPPEQRPPEDELWISPDRFAGRTVQIAEARQAALPQARILGGRIDFDDLRVTHVFSPVSGRVTRVLARLGQEVNKGTPLAEIVSPDVGSALSDEVKARADLVAAEHDWVRQKKLLAVKAAAERDYENAEDNYQRARAEEERAQQRLTLLRRGRVDAVSQEYQLASPIEGRVIARMVNPGIEVQGQFSGGVAVELFTIGSTATVWLYADVAEADLSAVQAGAAVTARVLAYPDRVFGGRIDWVSPALDPQLRTARVRCTLSNAGGLLKPQMFASVVVGRPALRGIAVPRGAVVRINDQSFVYVETGERHGDRLVFRRRKVETPNRAGAVSRQQPPAATQALLQLEPSSGQVQVLAGLAAGEKVLVDDLTPGPVAGQGDPRGQEVAISGQQLRSGRIAVAAVDVEPVHDLLDIGGRLAFDDLRVAHVFPPVGGRITKVIAAPGQHVGKGAPLAVIESPELGSAFSDVLKAKADLDAAEHEAKRQRELTALKVGVQRDLEAAEDNYGRAKAEYDRAEQRTRLLRQGAADRVSQAFMLRSPIDGEVAARMANPGLEVQGQYGGGGNVVELFTVGETDPLWLLGDVFEMDLPYIKVGDGIALQVAAYPGRTFHGTVDWISDVLDPVMRTAKVRCVLRNPEHLLRPEMYGMASLAVPARRSLSVPREALVRLGDQTVVFVASGETRDGGLSFRRRPVLAREDLPGGRVPILSGLQPGDRVAAHGAIFLVGLL